MWIQTFNLNGEDSYPYCKNLPAYYAGIMLNIFRYHYAKNYANIIGLVGLPTRDCIEPTIVFVIMINVLRWDSAF